MPPGSQAAHMQHITWNLAVTLRLDGHVGRAEESNHEYRTLYRPG